MKTSKKLGALLLVLLMLAGMMTAVSAKEYTDQYNGLGSLNTEEMYNSFVENHVPSIAASGGTTMSYNAENAAMEIAYPSSGTEQGRMHFSMKAEEGKTYAISLRAKAVDETTTSLLLYSDSVKPRISYGSTTEETSDMRKDITVNSSEWTDFTYIFTYTGETKEAAVFYFVHKVGGGYDYLVDDIRVIEITDSPVVGKTQEIHNQTFDSQLYFDLFQACELKSVVSGASIQYDEAVQAMKVTHESDGQGRVNLNSISYEKGATYTVSYKAKAAIEGGTPTMRYYVDSGQTLYRYQNGSFQSGDLRHEETLNSSTWTDVSFSFTYTGETKSFGSFFYFPTQADSDTDDYYIDDLVITKYIPDYPELKVTVEEQDAYISGETVKHTVYGVKDSVETPITEGVTYKSSDSAVVKVNEDGGLSAVGAGTATVTAVYDLVPVQFDVTIASVDGRLDLSQTEKTVLSTESPNNTSQIIVNAVYSASVEELVDKDGNETKDVSFATSNSAVATVSESGLVTAKKEGTAIITASYEGVSKSIVIIVGESKGTTNFDSAPSNAILALDTETKREGTGSWKIAAAPAASASALGVANEEGQTVSFWFYDDGDENYKGLFHITSTKIDGSRINTWMRINKNGYYTAENVDSGFSDFVAYAIQRSTGWHQIVIQSDQTNATAYLDGQPYFSGTITCSDKLMKNLNYYGESNSSGSLWIDDYASVDTTVKHDVTVSVGANGTVKNGDANVADGEKITVAEGESLTLTVAPETDYQAKVTVDGQEVALQDDNTVTISNITADMTVAVTFEQVITDPVISGSSADYIIPQEDYLYNNENHFAYVAYYKALIPASYTVNEMGMNFGDGTNTVPLKATGWTSDYLFGIRVFGDAVKKGNTYTFQGYAVVADEEGQESTITTGEPISK